MNIAAALALTAALLAPPSDAPYKNPKNPIPIRVADLLKRMTLQEKLNQLRCDQTAWQKFITTTSYGETLDILRPMKSLDAAKRANEVQQMAMKSRLGIPMVIHDEALHGLIGDGATSFPQSIGMAATWDPSMVGRVATAIAEETRARGVRHVLSPVINVIRDARWGRVEETYGEDPLLSSKMGVEYVKAFESHGVATTPKHYVDNSGDDGRDSNSVDISERLLREIYLPPFKAVIQQGGASTVMSAYNSLNGRACSASYWLLTEILRKEWGFTGWVASDYGAVDGIFEMHHNTANEEETAAAAVNAGLESEWPSVYIWGKGLDDAVRDGLISKKRIDEAVSRVLAIKFKTGVFDTPFADPAHVLDIVQSPAHKKTALDAAREAMTLLKNEDGLLPLKKNLTSIAVIGPNANNGDQLGGYSGANVPTVSVVDGIRQAVGPNVKVVWAPGSTMKLDRNLPPIPAPELRDVKGEYFQNEDLSGKPAVVRMDPTINFDWDQTTIDARIAHEHFSVRWTGRIVPLTSGNYTVGVTSDDGSRLWLNGKKLIDDWSPHSQQLNTTTYHFTAGVPVEFRLEYFQRTGGASCSLQWSAEAEKTPEIDDAVALAKRSDVAIIVAGIIEGEGQDRAKLDLPGNQEELIRRVSATGKPLVVVIMAGAPVTMDHWIGKIPAVLDAWYPGQEGGTAIAETLFGDNNPGGKLPMTFPLEVGQCPIYYNIKPTGRGYDYVDLSGKPLFPFGFGLSYTTFEYSNLKIHASSPAQGDPITVTFDVKNSGTVKGDEVPQLYLHQAVSSITVPLKELQEFRRITLKPGETTTVTFKLTPDQLAIWDEKMRRVIEPGRFDVMVGSSSDDIRLQGSFTER